MKQASHLNVNDERLKRASDSGPDYRHADNLAHVQDIARKVYEINPDFFTFLEKNPELVTKVENLSICINSPFPPPQILEQYERIYQGASKIIFDEYQRNAHHQREKEITVLLDEIDTMRRIQIFTFLTGVSAVVAGTACTLLQYPVVGAFIGGGGVLTLLSTAVFSYLKVGQRVRDYA